MSLNETLEYTDAIGRETAAQYARVRHVIPEIEWPVTALRGRDQPPQEGAQRGHPGAQLHDAGDLPLRRRLRGDSLALAQMAQNTDADVIVLAGVHFMAETAKLLNPEKTVLIPDAEPAARSPPRSPAPTCARSRKSIPAARS